MKLQIRTRQKREVIDLTNHINSQLPKGSSGVAVVTLLHTTAGLTTADLDPGTDLDLLDAFESLIAPRPWRHPHDPTHAPDHILASLIGPSLSLPYEDGQLILGTWQRVVLVELDGPKQREVVLTLLAK